MQEDGIREQQDQLWEYKAVALGQKGTLTEVGVREENIREYAWSAQNHDIRYIEPANATLNLAE